MIIINNSSCYLLSSYFVPSSELQLYLFQYLKYLASLTLLLPMFSICMHRGIRLLNNLAHIPPLVSGRATVESVILISRAELQVVFLNLIQGSA